MKKKSAILMIVTVLVVSMGFSIIAYGGDDGRETPILPLTGSDSSSQSQQGELISVDGSSSTEDSSSGGGWEMTQLTMSYNIKDCSVAAIANKVYTGKNITPAPTVKYNGKTLKKDADYTLSYKNNKYVGTATVTISGKGCYKGSIKKTFKIIPKGTSLKKLTAGKKAFTATWTKQATQTTGYQIQYSTSSKFSAKTTKTVTVSKNKTVKKTVKNLKGKKKYYVRIRTYKTVNKTKYYSAWSKAKYITTKK